MTTSDWRLAGRTELARSATNGDGGGEFSVEMCYDSTLVGGGEFSVEMCYDSTLVGVSHGFQDAVLEQARLLPEDNDAIEVTRPRAARGGRSQLKLADARRARHAFDGVELFEASREWELGVHDPQQPAS